MILSLLWIVSLITSSLCSVPLIVYSHTLVPKVQPYVQNFNHLQFDSERVNEVLRKIVEPCSSDAYIFVNQPGLTLDDLQEPKYFTFLRTYMLMSSTLGVIPRIEKPVNLKSISDLIARKCDTKTIEVNGYDEEAPEYIDTKKRLIILNLPALPEDPELRHSTLLMNDQKIRNTIRKLPSPHHSLIYTTLDRRILNKLNEKRWLSMKIFSDITEEPTRAEEYERNNNKLDVEPYFHEKRTNFIDKTIHEPPKLLDADFLIENELLVISIVFIVFALIIHQSIKLLIFSIKLLQTRLKSKKEDRAKKQK